MPTTWYEITTIDARALGNVAPPLSISGQRGEFEIHYVDDDEDRGLRVLPAWWAQSAVTESLLEFGWWLHPWDEEMLDMRGRKVYFALEARLYAPDNPSATLFIQDLKEDWQRGQILMDGIDWREYVVARTMRQDATDLILGIEWRPGKGDSWLEVRNLRVIVGEVGEGTLGRESPDIATPSPPVPEDRFPPSAPTATPTPTLTATILVEEERIATAVAATLTAIPAAMATPAPTSVATRMSTPTRTATATPTPAATLAPTATRPRGSIPE